MLNQFVLHPSYGRGTVVERNGDYLKLKFETFDGLKTFLYPDAFENFLKFEDEALQKKALEDLKGVLKDKKTVQDAKDLVNMAYEENLRKEHQEALRKKRKTATVKKIKVKKVAVKKVVIADETSDKDTSEA